MTEGEIKRPKWHLLALANRLVAVGNLMMFVMDLRHRRLSLAFLQGSCFLLCLLATTVLRKSASMYVDAQIQHQAAEKLYRRIAAMFEAERRRG